jgi:hypothetical protein
MKFRVMALIGMATLVRSIAAPPPGHETADWYYPE